MAVIDHPDLDGAAAEALIAIQPCAVVNAALSTTGRYPNSGPTLLIEAGIPLLDGCGEAPFELLHEGDLVRLAGDQLLRGGETICHGVLVTPEIQQRRLEQAREHLGDELERFSRNTLEFLATERETAVGDLALPTLSVRLRGRPSLVVVRGEGHRRDLAAVAPYIREQRPVLIAVDGGADALLDAHFRPHIIVGDMDSASDAALRCGAQLILHTYADGRPSAGRERLAALGLAWSEIAAPGTSEDLAMLLAYQAGASLIVAVGTHFSLVEFLDKRREGMASTFLTRLRVGGVLVDARGLSRLYRPGLTPGLIAGLIASALLPILIVILNSAGLQRWLGVMRMSIEIWLRRQGL